MHQRDRERESLKIEREDVRWRMHRRQRHAAEIRVRVRWGQILEREKRGESPLRARSTCLQHREREAGEKTRAERAFLMLQIVFFSWHTKVVGIQEADLFLSRAINLLCKFYDPQAHREALLNAILSESYERTISVFDINKYF